MGILSKKNIQKIIKIPKGFSKQERLSIAKDIISYIQDTASSGYSPVDGSKYVKYTKQYASKKGSKFVDLTLSGEMLSAIELLSEKDGELKIGYEAKSEVAGKAEGNQIGSYGQPKPNKDKARPFIGIKPDELKSILNQHGSEDIERLNQIEQQLKAEVAGKTQEQRISEESLSFIRKRVKFG